MLILFLLLLSPFTFADPDLDFYIKHFNLRPLPEVSPKKEDLYRLGLHLFHDKQLSGKGNTSCHSCHSVNGFSGDTLPLGVGEGAYGLAKNRRQHHGVILARNSLPLYNLGLPGVRALFWDGRVSRKAWTGTWKTPEPGLNGENPEYKDIAETLDSLLAVQALFPIANPEEMLGVGSTKTPKEAWEGVLHRLFTGRRAERYKKLFQKAFPGVEKFNIGHVGNAIAELERHLYLANDTPWDRYLKGQKKVLTKKMKRGGALFFGKASCVNCHNGPHLSSFTLLNVGAPQVGPGVSGGDDKGLYEQTGNPAHLYRFRVQPLRNVALTAPYMHSGAFKTIWEVIEHYNRPVHSQRHFRWSQVWPNYVEEITLDRHNIETRIANLPERILRRHLNLTAGEKQDLYCFLTVALTDMKFQKDLKGVIDEIDDCSPVLP